MINPWLIILGIIALIINGTIRMSSNLRSFILLFGILALSFGISLYLDKLNIKKYIRIILIIFSTIILSGIFGYIYFMLMLVFHGT